MPKKVIFLLLILFAFVIGFFVVKNRMPEENIVKTTADKITKSVENELSPLQELQNAYGEYSRLTIPYLQSQDFTGSQITIEQDLGSNGVYNSYIASYQSEGLKIYGLLTKPVGLNPENGFPAVVFLHGYIPPSQYVTTQKYEAYVNYLASREFVVFKIDYRGHGNSEGEPGGAYFSGDYVIDTINAGQSLKTLDYVDKSKINLWGHSMSGNVSLRSATAKPELFNKVVIWAGAGFTYQDFFEYRISDSSYVRPSPNPSATPRVSQRVRDKFGDFSENNLFWQNVAPTNFLNNNTPAIQLHHSSNDDVVNVEYSRNLSNILDQKGVEHEYFEYTTGGHNLNSPAFEQAMERSVDFYNSGE